MAATHQHSVCSTYDKCLGGCWYGSLSGFTCNENIPNHPIPVNTSSNSFCSCFVIPMFAFLSLSLLWPGRKYSFSLLLTVGKMALHSLLFKFELLPVFVILSLLGPGRDIESHYC